MNVFFLDSDPAKAARYHCNKHVTSQLKESVQILSTVHSIWDPRIHDLSVERELMTRRTHPQHPSVVWAASNIEHYKWLCELTLHLSAENYLRFDKLHAYQRKAEFLSRMYPDIKDPGRRRPPPQVMPDECKYMFSSEEDVLAEKDPYKASCLMTVKAYRLYYHAYKRPFAKWTERSEPHWWNPGEYA